MGDPYDLADAFGIPRAVVPDNLDEQQSNSDAGPPRLENHEIQDISLTLNETIRRVAETISEQLEYELRGAWRAGYDRVDVFDPNQPPLARQPLSKISLTRYTHPAYADDPVPDPDGMLYRYSYDFTSVPDDMIRATIRGEVDPLEVVVE